MGVDILSEQVTVSGCISSEYRNWPNENIITINSNSVKRSLFGPVDHEEAMSFFQKEFAKMEQEKMRQWNFDFVNGKPLRGPYKWEKVDNQKSQKALRNSLSKVTIFKSKKSPLKSRITRDSLNLRNKQTTITGKLSLPHCSIYY